MAVMTISFNDHVKDKNFFATPAPYNNVVLHSEVKSKEPQTNIALYEALLPIVKLHPDWRFVGKGVWDNVVCTFYIYKDDEELGAITIDYKGRGKKIKIDNRRIRESLERNNAKYTEDPVKAEKLIRKYFYPKLVDERIGLAISEASKTINSEVWEKTREYDRSTTSLFSNAREYAERYLDSYLLEYPQLSSHVGRYNETKLAMQTVTDVKKALDNGKYVLVVLDGTEYIVREGDEAKVYNNDTLPEKLRAKIGMLKLVEDGQMISGVGCRGNSKTLVLINVEEQAQA